MASYQDLVSVSFTDVTNHTSTNTDDVLGIVINHHWGPVNTLNVMTASTFRQTYLDSMPIGASEIDPLTYYAYAQVLKALDLGMNYVEVYRLNPSGGWKYGQVNITSEGVISSAKSNNQFSETAAVSIALLYPGFVPQSLASGYDNIGIRVSATDGEMTIKVVGVKDSEETTIETWEGTYGVNDTEDGIATYLPTVCESSSFIRVQVNEGIDTLSETMQEFPLYSASDACVFSASDVEAVYDEVFSDIELSSATLMISSFNDSSLDTALINLAKKRMNLNSVIGYPTASTFDATNIQNFHTSLVKDKFSFFVAGRETIDVMGFTLTSNCTGGWCGATANIASSVRINQLASARKYGSYSGTLTHTLKFDDVLTLHELGVISVYRSNSGPQIFGVRSLYSKQTSYFGKANVMRVLASILKNIFPIVLDAIHTDAAANAITRSSFGVQFQSVIDTYVSAQNLQSDSVADCGADLNTDTLTKGGTVFNLQLTLHFIGLVEEVNIAVVATDSSVTAEIV